MRIPKLSKNGEVVDLSPLKNTSRAFFLGFDPSKMSFPFKIGEKKSNSMMDPKGSDQLTETENGFMEPKYLAFKGGDCTPESSSDKVSQDP